MGKTAILTFMRCQPCPHKGHEMIFDSMRREWLLDTGSRTYFIYLSKTQNKKNPIPYNTKVMLAKKLVPLHSSRIVEQHPGTIISILKKLNVNYSDIIFYCGPDRVQSFTELITRYNKLEYNFSSIKVLSVGERIDNSPSISGISGTKMREFIVDQNFDNFVNGLPSSVPKHLALDCFKLVSDKMQIPQKV